MRQAFFFEAVRPLTLAEIVTLTGATLGEGADAAATIGAAAPVERALPGDLVFLDNTKYLDALATTKATACLLAKRHAARVPAGTAALITPEPYKAMAAVMAALYPAAMRPGSAHGATGIAAGAFVHQDARLESGVTVDPGASIGPGAEIGADTVIAAGAVIGPGVKIGRGCSVGPGATVIHALVGNRVIIHPGVRIGQDGFGFAMGPGGHRKVPQIGRVIIQDDVEIGANTTIDRGANRDTVIGEGTKIDNLVQIAHNVMIGRHCVIVAQVGIAGSAILEDYVAIGGQSGVIGHVRVGMGAQIAAVSNVATDVPPGARWGGTPAKPVREWFREVTALKKLAEQRAGESANGTETPDGR